MLTFDWIESDTPTVVEYTSGSGNWTCPAGVTSIYVECWGGSGGSSGSSTIGKTVFDGGDGSGGGAYAARTLSVVPGTNYPYVVGQGTTQLDEADRITTFNSTGTMVKADGGGDHYGGSAANCVGDVKYSGGNGAYGTTTYGGGGGSSAGPSGNGNDASGAIGGDQIDADSGDGGHGRTITGNGVQGTAPGGGAGGPFTGILDSANTGALGRPGKIRITYYT